MSDLKDKLDSESSGDQRRRGLRGPNANTMGMQWQGEVQTYEIYLPAQIREEYDQLHREQETLTRTQYEEVKKEARRKMGAKGKLEEEKELVKDQETI